MPTPHLATALLAAAAALLHAGCSVMPADRASPPAVPAPGLLPGSFVGDLPGASGTVRWHLDLLPEGRYQLRQTFVDRPPPNAFDDIGRVTVDGPRLTLRGGREAPLFLALRPDGALRRLDTEGRPIDSAHNDILQRLPAPAPIEPRLTLAGMFSYQADAPRIVLCADGRSLPVQMAGDYLALERAYSAAVATLGAPMLAQLEGRIALRPSAEAGRPPLPTLVVERFGRLLPGASCDRPPPDRPLVGTDWRLIWLGGQPVTPADPARPARLRFEGGRVAGSDGCNRITGPYTADGSALGVGMLAGTRMACAVGMDQAEAFTAALARVKRHAVRGDLLELMDESGTLLLRLQAD
jgi:copper homeostasis protein (lipoprotein)